MRLLDRLRGWWDRGIDREIGDLWSLGTRIDELPSAHPAVVKVAVSYTRSPEELVPLICRTIDDATRALIKGRDRDGNNTTAAEVGRGLANLVEATRSQDFRNVLSMTLSIDGVSKLSASMDELAAIARRLQAHDGTSRWT